MNVAMDINTHEISIFYVRVALFVRIMTFSFFISESFTMPKINHVNKSTLMTQTDNKVL